jgi:endonuclease/exonuclease/phosphatase family metal-dependent hydrolase
VLLEVPDERIAHTLEPRLDVSTDVGSTDVRHPATVLVAGRVQLQRGRRTPDFPAVAELSLATFNIYWGTAATTREPFDVVSACASLDADVLLLQECWRRDGTAGQAAEVGRELGYEVVESPPMARSTAPPRPDLLPWTRTDGATGDWYHAVLSRLPIRGCRTVRLFPQLHLDKVRRFVLSVDLDLGALTLPLAATHLPHLEMGAPLVTRSLRRALPAPDQPAVFAGDMNMWGWCVEAMAPAGWRRAVSGATWPARRPHSQIDHVLVTDAVEVVSGGAVPLVASDHRPVEARLRV